MPKISDQFDLLTARAVGFARYRAGDVAYVTNGFRNNGVVGFVKPRADDPIYNFIGIVLSAFCEATVQVPPFIARGNGGSGLIVLKPLQATTANKLAYVAAYINTHIRWRFSWSRMATVDRLKNFEIPQVDSPALRYSVNELIPDQSEPTKPPWNFDFRSFEIASIFTLAAGDYHNTSALPEGDTPLISCGDADNGITAFVEVPAEHIYKNKLTIAFS